MHSRFARNFRLYYCVLGVGGFFYDADEDDYVVIDKRAVQLSRMELTRESNIVVPPVPTLEVPSSPRSRKTKWLLTLWMSLTFLDLGIILALLGPTLLSLSHQVQASLAQMGIVFSGRSSGYLIGSILGGRWVDSVSNTAKIIALATWAVFIGTVFVPFARNIIILGLICSFQGFGMGILDVAGNLYMLRMWGPEVGPKMQTVHFSFAVGACIGPFIAREFLRNVDPTTAATQQVRLSWFGCALSVGVSCILILKENEYQIR